MTQIRPIFLRGPHVCTYIMIALAFGVATPKRWNNIDIGLSSKSNRTLMNYKDRQCLPRSEDDLVRLMDSHFMSNKMATKLPRGPGRELGLTSKPTSRAGRTSRHIYNDDRGPTEGLRTVSEDSLYSHETVDFKYPVGDKDSPTINLQDFTVSLPSQIDEVDNLKRVSSSDSAERGGGDERTTQKFTKRRLLQRTRRKATPPRERRRANRHKGRDRTGIGKTNLEEPPWHCELKTEWVRMPTGYFPPYVQTGRCEQSNCMFGMYQCKPKHYVIRVLRRNPEQCNPLPVLGVNTTYEEAWDFAKYKITICCECSRSRQFGRQKSRRKNKNKNKNKNKGFAGIGVE
ncbi:uncharacterized protein LOC135486270 isoform X2 [Lineus longissimus]|uniref:uncharacterized protein LOC135486270 isoform X2 n=1 Tax=Lineus longissimus TaxID=88925 RepID=UPI00315CE3B1